MAKHHVFTLATQGAGGPGGEEGLDESAGVVTGMCGGELEDGPARRAAGGVIRPGASEKLLERWARHPAIRYTRTGELRTLPPSSGLAPAKYARLRGPGPARRDV